MNTEQYVEHVAIIPDGNRRWAKNKGLSGWQGHYEGFKRVEEIVRGGLELGITHLTIWGGSYNNLTQRTKKEIAVLDMIYRKTAQAILRSKEFKETGTRVRFIGEWPKLLKEATVKKMREAEEATRTFDRYHLTALIGYNGDREMMHAIKALVKKEEKNITDEAVKKELWTADLPPVDLVIRTGGEPHLSTGFMMWDTRNAHLYFTETMWPAFSVTELKTAIAEFRKKERRYGK